MSIVGCSKASYPKTMMGRLITFFLTAALLSGHAAAQDAAPVEQPPEHKSSWPTLSTGKSKSAKAAALQLGPELQRNVSPTELLRERRLLDAQIDDLKVQRAGQVDTYVVSIALDSDLVFAREAREAARVLSRRYGADGRVLTLAGPDGKTASVLPKGSINALAYTLARLAEVMDPAEDVLILYTTSHGIPQGLAYHYGDDGYGILSPQYMRDMLRELGLEKRMLVISACYSGIFVTHLAGPDTAILTASAFNRTSFGCRADNDWTYFGDALINRALRKPQPLEAAYQAAIADIARWEKGQNLTPSLPQILIGESAKGWLGDLDAKVPRVSTRPVGKPSVGE